MKHLFLNFIILSFLFHFAKAEVAPVEVAELALNVPSRETREVYYGFEAGDELIFEFSDPSRKGLKQVEVVEYPSNVRYSGLQVNSVTKAVKVNRRAVYLFRFTNSSLASRVCNVRISRRPATEETAGFNPEVAWREVADTSYTLSAKQELVRYDTTFHAVKKREIARVDTIAQELVCKSEQVAALLTMGKPSESLISFSLPKDRITPFETSEVVSWAYWIGVGQEGHLAFEANKRKYLQALGGVAHLSGNPVVGLALRQFSFLPTGNAGSNVHYYFMRDPASAQAFLQSYDNKEFRYFDKGNGVSGYGRREAPLQGTFYVGLHNDNDWYDINVTVKIVAVVVRKTYREVTDRQATVIPVYEARRYRQPVVSVKRMPFTR
ncbi:hypothetical protein ACFSC6_10645 [Rufibacter sediminis]|uniref:Uncharacterized protein n=1 Tax=Rufibacter sediminis TaxID=2762756 RepID=A0ABR6VPB1_9BACT|nr:hypothetical protein [Rufibacter sediminis]MBC3538992.1 hypothetical protein [Rufibacter sediminis]